VVSIILKFNYGAPPAGEGAEGQKETE